jgi:hypothetical protein
VDFLHGVWIICGNRQEMIHGSTPGHAIAMPARQGQGKQPHLSGNHKSTPDVLTLVV